MAVSPSLEDRYGSARLDVLIHTRWSRTTEDPLLTVGALRASRHLARAWPMPDCPRLTHLGRISVTLRLASGGHGYLIYRIYNDIC